ncbi:DUF2934 domain-containing protein [Amaricoccus sp. W119]|uniref:DUF2934 domain-containing protein n=1 Tax=Amaricoccus sp. W119 TaxID=3391833 RepID=UPI0039A4EA1D
MTDERAIEDRIRNRAHEIWEREGKPEGQDRRHWDEARLEIEAEERVASASSPGAAGTLDEDSGDTSLAPEIFPEAGEEARNDEVPVETEAGPSQLDRSPM